MLCQLCSKNIATTHIKTIVNGEFTEYMLCPECAKKFGYMNLFDGFGLNFENFLGGFLGLENQNNEKLEDTLRCPICGSSFSDIASTGKIGCANCYTTFYDKLMPLIKRMYGSTTHTGKVSSGAGTKAKLSSEIERYKRQLNKAIEKQEFEKAAQLRDKIKEIEKQVNDND